MSDWWRIDERVIANLKQQLAAVTMERELLEALERLTLLLSELRPHMTLPNATQWAHLEEAHNAGCAALKETKP